VLNRIRGAVLAPTPPQALRPATPQPTYAAQILIAAAALLDQERPAAILTDPKWRGTYAHAVAAVVSNLPTPVADNAAAIAWQALPNGAAGNTYGEQAGIIRAMARSI
jgi:hypothetical protein